MPEYKSIFDGNLDIFTNHFKVYLIVGGMPEVVKKYLNTKSFTAAGEVQDKIMEAYLLDISKYALFLLKLIMKKLLVKENTFLL